MEKRLYRVKVVLFVMAENQSAACVAATRARFDIFDCAARKAEHVDPAWSTAVPYNADDDRSCSMILADEPLTTRLAAHSARLPANVHARIGAFDTGNRSVQVRQQT